MLLARTTASVSMTVRGSLLIGGARAFSRAPSSARVRGGPPYQAPPAPAAGARQGVSVETRATPRVPETPPVESPRGFGLNWLLAVCCVAQFMVILDLSIINVALPSIQSSLGFSSPNLQWVVDA